MIQIQSRLAISGESIQELYNWFINEILIVNRRYQRKLVWTSDEKEKLIDTIFNSYPIPLFLFAEVENGKNEIIDGMQRLSSIFHFIENKFSFNGKYFDLETLATTKSLCDQNILIQKEPKLERDACAKIVNYKLAISIYKNSEEELINDVFSRINSSGKKLSRQEIRQVGSTEDFADLVRIISEKIRGDISHQDILLLNKMQTISIDIEDGTQNSIKASSIYWCEKSILSKNDIRDGEDEALIANILATILTKMKYRIANDELDFYYGKSKTSNPSDIKKANERKVEINRLLSSYGKEKLCNDFLKIFDLIRILNFKLNSKRHFLAIFVAIYNLYFYKNKEVDSHDIFIKNLYSSLDKLETTQGGVWARDNMVEAIEIIEKLVIDSMKDSEKQVINNEKITEIENFISISSTESLYYDLKQGFHNLNEKNDFNEKMFIKVMKTICAISNNGKNEKGIIIIGIADTSSDKDKIEEIYNIKGKSRKVNNIYIPGLNGEISKYTSFEDYYKKIADLFEKEKTKFVNLGKCLLEPVDYYDRHLLLFKIESSNNICTYNSKVFFRSGPQTNEADVMKVIELTERFK